MKTAIRALFLSLMIVLATQGNTQPIPVWKLADLKAAIQNANGPTILNFWATFCKPCIAELPHFQELANQYKAEGVKLILVSLDLKEAYPQKVALFTKKLKISAPVVFLDESNADEFCPVVDSSWSGSIPATLFINSKTGYRKFYEEEVSKEKLEGEIKAMLSGQKQ